MASSHNHSKKSDWIRLTLPSKCWKEEFSLDDQVDKYFNSQTCDISDIDLKYNFLNWYWYNMMALKDDQDNPSIISAQLLILIQLDMYKEQSQTYSIRSWGTQPSKLSINRSMNTSNHYHHPKTIQKHA